MHVPKILKNKFRSTWASEIWPGEDSLVVNMDEHTYPPEQQPPPKTPVVTIEYQLFKKAPMAFRDGTNKAGFKKRFFRAWHHQFPDCYQRASHCQCGSIFGEKISPSEMIFWICWIIFGISLGGYMIGVVCQKWQSNQIVISVDSTNLPISSINFPAVTVCPVNKAVSEKMIIQGCRFNYTFTEMHHIISTLVDPKSRNNFDDKSDKPRIDPKEALRLLGLVAPKCSELILSCELDGQNRPCNELFQLVMTDTGFCCTFNAAMDPNNMIINGENDHEMHRQESEYDDLRKIVWNYKDEPDTKFGASFQSEPHTSSASSSSLAKSESRTCSRVYTNDIMTKDKVCDALQRCRARPEQCGIKSRHGTISIKHPVVGSFRTSEAGTSGGLTFLVDTLQCAEVPTDSFKGVQVYVHAANEFPEVGEKGFAVGPGQEALVSISATDTYSSDALKNSMGLANRQCKLADEVFLKDGREYSQSLCWIRCQHDYILKQCGCVPFYSVDAVDPKIQVCSRDKLLDCGKRAIDKLKEGSERKDSIFTFGARASQRSCAEECLPSCNKTSYSAGVTAGQFPNQNEWNKTRILREAIETGNEFLTNVDYVSGSVSLIRFFFKEPTIVQYKQDVLYTGGEIFLYISGIMCLCIGFSMLPPFYFFVVQTKAHLKRCGQEGEIKLKC